MKKFELSGLGDDIKKEDVIPEGTFFYEGADNIAGIRGAIDIGKRIQESEDAENIVRDFRSGDSLSDIVKKYNIRIPSITFSTAKNAVRFALFGYDGNIEHAERFEYDGLIGKTEYLNLVEDHTSENGREIGLRYGVENGNNQLRNKTGIHSQSTEQNTRFGKEGVIAQGSRPYSEEEMELISELSKNPEFQRLSRINAKKISEELNRVLHDGEVVRSPKQIKKMYYAIKQKSKLQN